MKSLIVNIFFIFFITNNLFAKNNITLQLKWKHQFQFAGFYMAKEKGFYSDVDLNVRIDELQEKNPIDSVLDGEYTFAVDDSRIIFEKMKDKEITALFSIFQHSPLVLVGLEKNGLDHPNKLKNKIIEISDYSVGNIAIQTLLINSGVDFIKKPPTFSINDLIDEKTDLISGYISNEPFRIKEKGFSPLVIDPKDWGIDFYGDLVYTSNKILKEKPKIVEKFHDASLKGWLYAFKNIEETVNLILEKYNTQNKSKDALIFEANELKNIVGNLKEFGKIDPIKVRQIASVFALRLDNKFDFKKLDNFIYKYKKNESIKLTKEEHLFLSQNKEFTICTQYNFYPFDGVKSDKVIGILGEYLSDISNILNIKFKPIPSSSNIDLNKKVANGKCDIISSVSPKSKRFKNIVVTKPFMWDDFGIITSIKVPTINISQESTNDKVFYVLFDVHKKLINNIYPDLNIQVEKDIDKIMRIIENDKNSVYLSLGVYAERVIQKYGFDKFKVNDILSNAKINGSLGIKKDLPILRTILDKTISFLEKNKNYNHIRQRYILKEYRIDNTNSYLFYLLGILILALLYISYRYHLTKMEKLKLQEELNSELNAEKSALIQLQTAGIFHIKDKRFLWVNDKFNEMLGFNKNEVIGKDRNTVYKKDYEYKTIEKKLSKALRNKKTFNGELKLKRKDNTDIIVNFSANVLKNTQNETSNRYIEFIGMIIDITQKKKQELQLKELNETLEEKVKEQTEQIKRQALKDPLTQSYNRKAYNEKINYLLEEFKRYKTVFSIIYVDLDDFKKINDNFGHHKGDEVLINFCKIIKEHIRINDDLYRMGGEEFAILLPNTQLETAKIVANKILDLIRKNLKVNDENFVTISGGLVQVKNNDTAELLYKRVDELLYQSKKTGKDKIIPCN